MTSNEFKRSYKDTTRFQKKDIDFVLTGGLALSTMGIFRLFSKEDLLDEWLDKINR